MPPRVRMRARQHDTHVRRRYAARVQHTRRRARNGRVRHAPCFPEDAASDSTASATLCAASMSRSFTSCIVRTHRTRSCPSIACVSVAASESRVIREEISSSARTLCTAGPSWRASWSYRRWSVSSRSTIRTTPLRRAVASASAATHAVHARSFSTRAGARTIPTCSTAAPFRPSANEARMPASTSTSCPPRWSLGHDHGRAAPSRAFVSGARSACATAKP